MAALRFLFFVVLTLVADFGVATAADITVTGAWIRALPEGLPAAGYFVLHNGKTTPLVLTAARSAACGTLMLHQSQTAGGMSSMDDVDRVVIAPGASTTFAPGGYHLMCMNPTSMLQPGAKVDVALGFADGSTYNTVFTVRGANGR